MISEATVMSKPVSRGTPCAGPPRPITRRRSARSFMSRTRFQRIRRVSSPSVLPWARWLSSIAASRLCAAPIACMSPVKWRLMSSIGATCVWPPPVPPPLTPKTGPSDGSRMRDDRALAEPAQPVGEADRGRRLALAGGRRRHRRHEHERAVRPRAAALDHLPADLRLVAPVRLEVAAVEAECLTDRLDRLELHRARDVDVLFSHVEILMTAGRGARRRAGGATRDGSAARDPHARDGARRRRPRWRSPPARRSSPPRPCPSRRPGISGDGVSRWPISGSGRSSALGQRVVHQRRGEELAAAVVDDAFEERLADALGHRAVDLPLDDHRIDHGPAVLDERVARARARGPSRGSTSTAATWTAPEKVGARRVEVDGRLEPGLDVPPGSPPSGGE